MMSFISEAEPLLQGFWYIAIPTSLIFIIQSIITIFGIDFGDGFDDFNGADFEVFSWRNFINFLLGFSWTGISFYTSIKSPALLIFTSLLVGSFFVYLFFKVIEWFMRLAEDNSFSLDKAIGQTGEVYLTIPPNAQSSGKVIISVNGSVHELEALSLTHEIKTGSKVLVTQIEDQKLIVEVLK
jgi:membrane-bound ClpP family serine protease